MKKYGGSGYIAPPFLTSALAGGEWSASLSGRFTSGEITTSTHHVWAPEPVWMPWKRDKYCLHRDSNPGCDGKQARRAYAKCRRGRRRRRHVINL
jgi:hypothetical protein